MDRIRMEIVPDLFSENSSLSGQRRITTNTITAATTCRHNNYHQKIFLFLWFSSLMLILNFVPEQKIFCLANKQQNSTTTSNHNQQQKNLNLFRYNNADDDDHSNRRKSEETTTTMPYYVKSFLDVNNNSTGGGQQESQTVSKGPHHTDLYTVQLTGGNGNGHPVPPQHRQAKHDIDDIVWNFKCPKQHHIHPCDCLELDKRAEMFDGSGDAIEDEIGLNSATPTIEVIEVEPDHPDLIETVVLCKGIRSVQVLTEAIRGFQGHRINYFVLDGCKIPPFPNNLFKGINVLWMEILNSTVQFHENFLHSRHCP